DDAGTTGHQSGSQGTTSSGGDTSGELEGASSGDVLTDGGEAPPDAAPMDSHPTTDEEDSSCGQIDGATDCADTGVDICLEDNGGCDALSTCKSTPAGAECGACPSGYA